MERAKTIREAVNFERGNPRDTLGVGWKARMKQEMVDDGWKLEGYSGASFESHALQWAAWNDHEEYVKNLIEEGVSIESDTLEGAVEEKSSMKIIKMLLDEGAYVTADLVFKAAEYDNLELIKLLYDNNPNMDSHSLNYIIELYAEESDHHNNNNIEILKIIFDKLNDKFFDEHRHELLTTAMKGSGHNRNIVRLIIQQEMQRKLWNDKV